MNPEIFAEWYRSRGIGVAKSFSTYWVNLGPRVFQAFPFHWLIQPEELEIQEFLVDYKAFALRYSTTPGALVGLPSYHAVFEGDHYDLNGLSRWARKNVRRGIKNTTIEPISFEFLARAGLDLQLDTLDRQGRHLKSAKKIWPCICLAAKELPGFEAWGAFVEGSLAASVITFQMVDCCYMLYQQCLRKYLKEHVNNALGFMVTQTMVKRPQIRSILYGLQSLDAPASVDEFKFRLGYSARPVRQRVVFHPWLRPLAKRSSHRLLSWAHQRMPANPALAKAEGMVRFYLQGNVDG